LRLELPPSNSDASHAPTISWASSAATTLEPSAKGAVGDISGRFFDIAGNPVVTELDERILALSLGDLQTISPVVAAAGGDDKVEAILGALWGGYLDVLIVDEETAGKVLKRSTEARSAQV